MRYPIILFAGLMMTITIGCHQKIDSKKLYDLIEKNFSDGNLSETIQYTDSLKKYCAIDSLLVQKADSIKQIAERIPFDFSLTPEQVQTKLKKTLGNYSPDEFTAWEHTNWIEGKTLDGEKRYFNRTVSNLVLLRDFKTKRVKRDSLEGMLKNKIFRRNHTEMIIKVSGNNSKPVIPVKMKVDYTISVNPDIVPPGEIVRCWLPWPKENEPRQHNVTLISTSQPDFYISPDSAVHRTLYMEKKSEKGAPVIFNIVYSYESSGQYFDLKNLEIKPYNKTTLLYKKYTSEQLPQICFTENVKRLADSIAGDEKNPSEIVKKIYYWFNKKIPWAGAMEYSIIPNIPEYVLLNKKGDCGMQTFLLMSMLRYKGIPVKWQSGWMMPPDDKNLHDWCEVYYEGTGWVPVDVSYQLQYSKDQKTREFYISGIDSYRLVVNEGVSGKLFPAKKFLRSEPFDFQRGEVEWSGGNLYFDKWDYNMKIEYSEK